MTHASAGVLHVARSPWDEVNVAMENGLACDRAGVHSDVEPLDGTIFLENCLPQVVNELIRGQDFLRPQSEVIWNVPLGDHKRMHWGDRKAIADGEHVSVFQNNALFRDAAEEAGLGAFAHVGMPASVWEIIVRSVLLRTERP